MVDKNALRAAWVKKGLTQTQVAQMIGISDKTLGRKLKNGVFGSDEIERLIVKLDISDPMAIFFPSKVALKDTKMQQTKAV